MHIKRIISPAYRKGGKKTSYWAVSPKPGSHPKNRSIPLLSLIRDILGFAKTSREAVAILNSKQVKVDGKICSEKAYPVGLMDVVSFENIKKNFRIVPYKLGLRPIEIPEVESNLKLLKVTGKTCVSKGKVEVTLHDGRNLLIDDAKKYSVGDSLQFDLGSRNVLSVLKLEKGSLVLICDGTHKGEIAKLVQVQTNLSAPDTVILESEGRKTFETLKDYVIALGKDEPVIKVQ